MCYELGRGVAKDTDKAIRLYRSAAEQGHAYAAYRLALCYDRGLHADPAGATVLVTVAHTPTNGDAEEVSEDTPRARDAQDEREEPEIKAIVASDRARAAGLYRQASEGGVPEADYALYLCHRYERVGARDEQAEIACLRRAAEGGSLQAAFELGLCYMEGRGLPRDHRRAVVCFTCAADLWRACAENSRALTRALEIECLPPDALTLRQAAGGALSMLGYCTLYGLGEGRGHTAVHPETPPSPERVESAAKLFSEAADIDHVGAIIMLGDLTAYGLLPSETASPEDESLRYYLEAVRVDTANRVPSHGGAPRVETPRVGTSRVGTPHTGAGGYTRASALRDRTDGTVDMLMSLAARATRVAKEETDPGTAEMARVNAWKSYSECAERGSADALVGMAACLFCGHGAPENPAAAVRLLRRAETLDGGRVMASLWLGDALRSARADAADPQAADEAYLRGLNCRFVEWEGSPYVLGLRRADRKQADVRARAELLYRVATLRAMYFADQRDRRQAFPYLAEAVLMGHEAARDDLARMFAYEISRPRGATLKAGREGRKERRTGAKARLRRMKEEMAETTRNSRGLRVHHAWLSDYYTALWPEPTPFTYSMQGSTHTQDLPAYVTAPVTDLMRLNALQYLGECYFEGYGLTANAKAAVACYREVLRIAQACGDTSSASVTEASYSLGWCLLYGVGTPADYPEAIRLLTRAARTHAGASYTLGVCHEEGRGVVAADDREALKHYRKAQRMGLPAAAAKVAKLEKRLARLGDLV